MLRGAPLLVPFFYAITSAERISIIPSPNALNTLIFEGFVLYLQKVMSV